jgi:hypothetical protein
MTDGPRELLSMLAPHGQSYTAGGGCDRDRLTPEDVAGAMAWGKLHPRNALLARIVIAGDRSQPAIEELERWVYQLTIDLALHHRWIKREPKGGDGLELERGRERLRWLSFLALVDVICVTRRCRSCQGSGYKRPAVVCPTCFGTGRGAALLEVDGKRLALTHTYLAERTGVRQQTWSECWAPKVAYIAAELEVGLTSAEKHCRRYLRDRQAA